MDTPFGTPQPDHPDQTDQEGRPEVQPDAEAELLEGLERDLAAVEEAMHTLDRIAADGVGGEAAAAQIAEVVSARRFPDGAPVTTLDLTEGR